MSEAPANDDNRTCGKWNMPRAKKSLLGTPKGTERTSGSSTACETCSWMGVGHATGWVSVALEMEASKTASSDPASRLHAFIKYTRAYTCTCACRLYQDGSG